MPKAKPHFVIASVGEAIQFCSAALDCFVATAPRNDGRQPSLMLASFTTRLHSSIWLAT